MRRSPSPSKANPTSARTARRRFCKPSGCNAPQPALMLVPSGWTEIATPRARSRQHADHVAVGSCRQQSGHHGRFEQRPRAPRVAADDEPDRPVVILLAQQRGDELATDAIREIRRERRLVGDAADAVGAEQTLAQRSRRISTVTCTVLWVVGYTESGSSNPTVRVTLWRRSVTSTGTVSTVARSSIVVRGPLT